MSRSTFIFNPRSAVLLQEAAASTRSSGSSFSWQLYQMLADAESYDFQSIISWQPHGRAFRVHDPEKFEQMILPSYFKSSKYKSFSRQLNLYSFVRLSRAGPDQGAYFHRQFIKEDPQLCKYIPRQKGEKRRLLPSEEPNFYADATSQVLLSNREISSDPPMAKEEVVSASTILASSSSGTIAKSSSVARTPFFGAMQKKVVGKNIPRAVSTEGSPIVYDTSASTNDSVIPKRTKNHMIVYSMPPPHLVLDAELHDIPKSSCSTPQQEVLVRRSTQNYENVWLKEEYIAPSTKRRPFSYFKNWIQDYSKTVVGDFEGRKFYFVDRCDRLENCMDIQELYNPASTNSTAK